MPTGRSVERAYKRYKLEEVLALFQQSYQQFGLEVIPYSTIGRTYLVEHRVPPWVKQRDKHLADLGMIRVLVLGRSSEWYQPYRLNTYADNIDGIVGGTHDSCLPIPVFALDMPAGTYFQPRRTRYTPFDRIPEQFWHTERGHKMLVGALMCKLPEAERVLHSFKRSTRYHIELECKHLLHRRPGRPIAGASTPIVHTRNVS